MSIQMAAIVPHPPIILPQIGQGQEREIKKTIAAYREIARRVLALAPDTIVILSSHATSYMDYFHISPGKKARGDLRRFGAEQVQLNAIYDEEFALALEKNAKRAGVFAGTKGEREKALDHGTIIPLTFLAERELKSEVVRIGLSGMGAVEHYRLGKCIKKTAEELNRSVAVIASGDLSHKLLESGPYGYHASGPEFDRQATEAMAEGDFLRLLTLDSTLCDEAAECGLGTFWILAGTLDRTSVKSELISYEGPFGVGYALAAFTPQGADESRAFDVAVQRAERAALGAVRSGEDVFVRLARETIESFVRKGEAPQLPQGLPEEMTNTRAGVFVSLKIAGKLRGCIGTISAVSGNIAQEIVKNAIAACSEDPRFDPVRAEELERIVYSVDVLGPTERIDSKEQLDVKRYGVIVISGYRKGLLLPNLEGVDTVEEQLKIAKQKAGIPESERCRMERFEVVRHT